MTTRRRAIAAAFAATMAVVAPAAIMPAASHAAAYRYWSYWLGSEGDWAFANVGPAFRIPADGTLEGWRFAISGVQGNQAPSSAPDFDAVCGATPPEDGRKRVAVVVDPGAAQDAPEGEQAPGAWAMCVVAEPQATGYEVLRAAATVRTERGLICGIGGYPSRGCAEVIADPSPTPTATKSPKPSPKPTRTPDPTPTPTPTPDSTATSTTPDATVSSQSPDPQPAAETSAAPSVSSTPSPIASATPTPTPTTPTPTPSYSLLTAPLQDPPADSGIGGALVAGIAVVGIAGLGGAAILRMRRST